MFLILLGALAFSFAIHGIDQELKQKYDRAIDENKGTFTCFDNSRKIPLSKLNDNYRDCDDGSDEPETPQGNWSNFYCQNNGYVPYYIPRWSVGDGICDCCDGSDEIHNKHANCPNTCSRLEDQRQKLIKELSVSYQSGIEEAENLKNKGLRQKADYIERLESIKSKISSVNSQIEQLEKLKKKLNLQTPLPTPTEEPEDEGDDSDKYTDENEYVFDEENEQQTKNGEPPQAEEQQTQTDEYPKEEEQLNKEATVKEGEPPKEEEQQTEETTAKEEEQQTEETTAKEEEQQTEEPTAQQPTNAPKRRTLRDLITLVWKYTFFVADCDVPSEESDSAKLIEKQITRLRNELRDFESKKCEIEDSGNIYNQTVPPQFFPLYDELFRGDGNVELRFMCFVQKGTTKLGIYRSYEGDKMQFDGGQHCWQIRQGRKAEVQLMCWSENKLVSTVETSQCVYRVIFATPAVCKEENIKELYNMTVPQLLELKALLGI